MSYLRPRSGLGSNQSKPSKFALVRRSMRDSMGSDAVNYSLNVTGSHPFSTSGSVALGSNQSAPGNYGRVARAMGMGAAAVEYALTQSGPVLQPPPPPPKGRVLSIPRGAARRYGFGSLGDATDAPLATSLALPTLAAPTIVDPAVDPWSDWRTQMLTQTSAIAAAQQDFTSRESLQRWFQIAATLAIPLSAAIWRAIFRGGKGSTRDFE
jgi:hypothetical protein